MLKNFFPASALTAALSAGGAIAPVQAGHAMGYVQGQMPHSMPNHGAMQHQQRQDDPAKLGVAIAAVSQADLDRFSLEYGVRVEKVLQGSVAEAAGIEAGDLVTAVNDRPAYSPERLQYLVNEAAGASTVAISRNGESLTLDATFFEPQAGNAMLGVRIQEMTNELKEVFGSEGDAGVLISQAVAGSAAKKAGLKAGDVIVSLGKDDIATVRDVKTALGDYAPGEKIDIAYLRDREKRSIQIELGGSESRVQQAYAKHPHASMWHGKPGHGYWGGHGYHGHHGMMLKKNCGVGEGQRRS